MPRLIDCPGVAELEYKALLKPGLAQLEARHEDPEIDDCSRRLFGLTLDEAQACERPLDWDGVEYRPVAEQLAALGALGWDLTDNRRRPLRMFDHFNTQLWLALRGVAGSTPFQPERAEPEAWAKALAREAARFKKR